MATTDSNSTIAVVVVVIIVLAIVGVILYFALNNNGNSPDDGGDNTGCQTSADCGSGYKCGADKQCHTSSYCDADYDCLSNQICDINKHSCATKPCSSSNDCSAGFSCISQKCVVPCSSSSPCPNSNQKCTSSGICVDCLTNADCGSNQTCNSDTGMCESVPAAEPLQWNPKLYGGSEGKQSEGFVNFQVLCNKDASDYVELVDVKSGKYVDALGLRCHSDPHDALLTFGGLKGMFPPSSGGSPWTFTCSDPQDNSIKLNPGYKGFNIIAGDNINRINMTCSSGKQDIPDENCCGSTTSGGTKYTYTCPSGKRIRAISGQYNSNNSLLSNLKFAC